MNDPDWIDQVARFRASREAAMRAPYGWLSLVARFVLEPGPNDVGDGRAWLEDDGTVRLELLPSDDGTLGPTHVWRPADGPSHLDAHGRRYEVMRQGPLVGLRIKDPQSQARAGFSSIPAYAPDRRWCLPARLEPCETPRSVPITTGLGAVVDYDCAGTLVFDVDGRSLRLDALVERATPDQLFVVFRDLTAPDETYGAGRFVYVPVPGPDGVTQIDFNRAYSPPCAFTPFASCPMPPPQNILDIRIEAGEKTPH